MQHSFQACRTHIQLLKETLPPDPNVVSNKIIVSNKLLGLLRLGFGFGFGSGFILYA